MFKLKKKVSSFAILETTKNADAVELVFNKIVLYLKKSINCMYINKCTCSELFFYRIFWTQR